MPGEDERTFGDDGSIDEIALREMRKRNLCRRWKGLVTSLLDLADAQVDFTVVMSFEDASDFGDIAGMNVERFFNEQKPSIAVRALQGEVPIVLDLGDESRFAERADEIDAIRLQDVGMRRPDRKGGAKGDE